MLPRRLLCGSALRRAARLHPIPAPLRLLSSSATRPAAAAQLAEVETEHEPYYHHIPSGSGSGSGSASSGPSSNSTSAASSPTHVMPSLQDLPLPGRPARPPRNLVQLQPPLPFDVADPFYNSTAMLDKVSMISVCLRRPESVPRAYQIFRQLLRDSRTGETRMPDAETWAKMIQGLASIGKFDHRDPTASSKWLNRAQKLVHRWEEAHGCDGTQQPAVAGAEEGGLKVYQGWFAGLVSASPQLIPMRPYFENRAFTVGDMLHNIPESDLPMAYDALRNMCEGYDLGHVMEQVEEYQGFVKVKQEKLAHVDVDEVKPVLEKAGRNLLHRRTADGTDEVDITGETSEAGEARFAVRNLRNTLSKLAEVASPRERQLALEVATYDAAREEMLHAHALMSAHKGAATAHEDTVLQRQRLQSWMHEWHGTLRETLTTEIDALRQSLDASDAASADGEFKEHAYANVGAAPPSTKDDALALYLTLLPPDKLALVTVIEIMRTAGSHGEVDGMKALRAMLNVGKAVETEYRAETIRSVAGVDSPQWLRTLDPQTQKPTRTLVGSVWRKLGRQINGEDSGTLDKAVGDDLKSVWTPPWSQMAQLGVGSFLVTKLLETAKVVRRGKDPETQEPIEEKQPAFTHGYDYLRGKKLGVIRLNPVVAERLTRDVVSTMIQPKHLPMLVEPRPWVSADDGGYIKARTQVMRYKDSVEQQRYLTAASDAGHLESVFHGLDVLSSTPWTINRRVFDVVLEAWNNGDAIADIPATQEKASYEMPDLSKAVDPAMRSVLIERAKTVLSQSRKDHAERCKYNYNIEIARSFLNETFYLPHSMDFRGRAYPIPPHLSPVGDDLCRGLLTFGVKRALGKTGLKWLQIHLANLYGFDKVSFEDRARFSQDHEADIFDSADNPLTGNKWWLKAEDPWQCLATCFELTAALRSEDPEKYESSLPVHQDGTCNGMQHYAALGGDVRGAKAVNLENGDRPADIYTGVADVVNRVIEQDRLAGKEEAKHIPSALGRKVVKQTVMTTVYGVTFVGARDQIARQLVARGDIPPEHIFMVSAYVAKTVLSCIGDLFSGANDIMDWLTTTARLVARSIPPERVEHAVKVTDGRGYKGTKPRVSRLEKELMTSVIWTTPLGLPVVQPYRKATKKQVMTALQSVYIADPNAPSEVSPHKQATAFPPNFIHSLDATHMLLTAVQCKQKHITFSSVHDSYWTHAATVEPMSEMIRDMFIHLHSRDLVGELRDEFIERYGEHRIPVRRARLISANAVKKRAKDEERRKKLAPLLEDPSAEPAEVDAAVADAIVEDHAATVEAEAQAEGEVEIEDEDAGVKRSASSASMGPLELTPAEIQALRKNRDDDAEIPIETIDRQQFVKFKDVISVPPARGSFDVSRIKDSAYFFS